MRKLYKDKTLGLTAEILRMLVIYDAATGDFHDRNGRKVGFKQAKGIRITLPGFGNFGFMAHRLAWLYMTGEWPEVQVDHENRDPFYNAWSNLREANNSQNQANRGLRPHNKSGVTGVVRQGNGWLAECSINGQRWRKIFKTKGEAVAARQSAVQRLHAEYGVE